jgi:hypothetical protein
MDLNVGPFKNTGILSINVVMKMSKDFPINPITTTNYELFCDVEIVMKLTHACCLCWRQCKVWTSLFKTKIVSFVILWQQWSLLKLVSTMSMWSLIIIFHMTSSRVLWIWWSLNLMCCQQFGTLSPPHKWTMLPFASRNNFTCYTKLINALELCPWSLRKIG